MTKKPETLIVEAAIEWLQRNGGDAFHVHGGPEQRKDEPDLCGEWYSELLGEWLHLKLEAKTPDGTESSGQEMRRKIYAKRGYVTGVFTSVPVMILIIRNYERQKYNDRTS